jgi:hypothetical protein
MKNIDNAGQPALTLRRHSIRDLTPNELRAAHGGKGQDTQSCSPKFGTR